MTLTLPRRGIPRAFFVALVLATTVACQTAVPEPTTLPLHVQGTEFRDAAGRQLWLRAINLGGGSKLPRDASGTVLRSTGATYLQADTLSFVDRPLPLDAAAAHLARIRSFGFNTLRLAVTWEAIMPRSARAIDSDYLGYLRQLCQLAGGADLRVILDMHQDVWSRYSGGSGAPRWTLEAAGLDTYGLAAADAAIVPAAPPAWGYPVLVWPTNHTRLATATMFSLFWAGDRVAPGFSYAGQSVQSYLQEAYRRAWLELAAVTADLPHVIGADLMNEPGLGYLGIENLNEPWDTPLTQGAMPTPAQTILGAVAPQSVPLYEFAGFGFSSTASVTLNAAAVPAFQSGRDPWAGRVWDYWFEPDITVPEYFTYQGGRTGLVRDVLVPWYMELAADLRRTAPNWVMFLEPPYEGPLELPLEAQPNANLVYSPHWYDALPMLKRRFDPAMAATTRDGQSVLVLGEDKVQQFFVDELARYKSIGDQAAVPTWIGEFGLPYDLSLPDFSSVAQAYDMYYRAMEQLQLHSALWNYVSDNHAEDGDGWNGEDFSVVSDVYPEGRARSGYVRPASLGIAGTVLEWSYERSQRKLLVRWRTDPDVDAPTQLLMPTLLYGKSGHDATVTLSPAALRHKWSGDVLVIDQRDLDAATDAILTVTVTNGTSLSD